MHRLRAARLTHGSTPCSPRRCSLSAPCTRTPLVSASTLPPQQQRHLVGIGPDHRCLGWPAEEHIEKNPARFFRCAQPPSSFPASRSLCQWRTLTSFVLCCSQRSARIDDEGLPRPGAGAPLHQVRRCLMLRKHASTRPELTTSMRVANSVLSTKVALTTGGH